MGHALTKKFSQEFFEAPTAERFLELQQYAIEAADGYDFAASKLLALEAQLNTTSPSTLLEELKSLPEIFQICPRYHYVEARIRESLGEVKQMQDSIGKLRACLRAIVETGEGSQESPFVITFVSDQDDVVRSLGEQVRCTTFLQAKDHSCDVVTAHSGVEFWFDVTPIVARRTLKSGAAEIAAVKTTI